MSMKGYGRLINLPIWRFGDLAIWRFDDLLMGGFVYIEEFVYRNI